MAAVSIDPSVVRGLEYYTGPVFEAEITTEVMNEDGQTVRFGSVGGGGRYDGLVERFTRQQGAGHRLLHRRVAPAGGARRARTSDKPAPSDGPVVVLVMEKDRTRRLPEDGAVAAPGRHPRRDVSRHRRHEGADEIRRQARRPCVVIQGGDERAKGEVQIKDLIEGAKAAATIKDTKEWREGRPAQISVKEDELVAKVREILARHKD